VEVRDPDGAIVPRFSGAWAPAAGRVAVEVPVPANALPGGYAIRATLPQTGRESNAAFTVE
jgi:uncharacterized protein YfaS (alpha-2-macroglobulin family)